ncbi:MAG: hypothetical protein FJ398_10290 [Verrucomicrobia bacterium]|nr:hypothetical protein [Verrucomicrobiota bacterium]
MNATVGRACPQRAEADVFQARRAARRGRTRPTLLVAVRRGDASAKARLAQIQRDQSTIETKKQAVEAKGRLHAQRGCDNLSA